MKQSSRITAYVDGSQMLYRAEYGFPARIISRTGHDITGLFGFLALTRKALHGCPITLTHAVVVFDAEAPVARSRVDGRYKADRQPLTAGSPDNPFRHLPWIKRSLESWGLPYLEHESMEADDVIASLVHRSRTAPAIVVSRDKDFHQIVSAKVTQWDSSRGGEKGWITPEMIRHRYGIEPAQWCDYVALVGDPSDGMPGIRGIGAVTARRLLTGGLAVDDLATELTREDHRDALRQRDVHRLDRHLPLPPCGPTEMPESGLLPAAPLLESLGVWDSPYP
ncbi:5'-3' exonuclease [Brachybacterium alimentarium]|uniref:5'-3' exonuclease n=1 Tax=Brachybacterium alimentarium TaxID=47845 RepID=UPI003FD5C4CC